MSTEQRRDEFENVMRDRLGKLIYFTRNDHNDYIKLDAAVAWISWQSSRLALVVDLPLKSDAADFMHNAPVYSAEEVAGALSAAGITVRDE
ncbi:hypothetical protein B7L51_019340 [Pectobacterium brasiliense]|uniref:hypothetical protein n=1 Tax=Pectobacterium brasiliense TaxID=180957 RepID=UPI000B961F2C|nr:hypothetical protein [Pectobacterium carotovorum]OYN49434.1 hypothetical protein B7L51_19385 [Pectobacterium carotovorum]